MRRLLAAFLCAAFLLGGLAPAPAIAQSVSCSNFDAWVWAQTVYDSNPDQFAALDPDGNDVACENLTVRGFAPVTWTDEIPASAEAAQFLRITDGDTFHVAVNGQEDTIRMYHIDTPEKEACGYQSATDYLGYVLGYAPGGTLYLEYDQTERDRYDRRLAYVWYELGGDVYLVNEVMVRNGWAASEAYRPDVKYSDRLNEAEQFSVNHVLGVRMECGKFKQAPGSEPSNQQKRQAQQRQPNQGQFYWLTQDSPGSTDGSDSGSDDSGPGYVAPTQEPEPAPASTGNCDPSYPGVCIPPRSQVGDLDCRDISDRRFQVIPPDPHNFDGDFDGIGCEGE